MRVTFACPSGSEPIAWALCLDESEPFRADWRAERGSGRKPTELPRLAIVPRAETVRARIYFVDGKIANAMASLTTDDRSQPTSCTEATT